MSPRWLAWTLLSPSQVLLSVTLLGGLLLLLAPPRIGPPTRLVRTARMLAGAGTLGLLLFGLLPVAQYLALPLAARFPVPQLPAEVTGIILLAGSETPWLSEAYGEPQTGAHGSRYITALRLAERYPAARVVFTGGPRDRPGTGPLGTQSAVAAAVLGSIGLDPARVSYDQQSRDTCQHPGNVRNLAQPRPGEVWVVVTSAMHMPRTVGCFRAAGWPEIVPYPTDHEVEPVQWNVHSFKFSRNLRLLDSAAHEWLGLLFYRLSGRIAETFPGP